MSVVWWMVFCPSQPFSSDRAYRPPNCAYVQLRYNGWPHVFVITLRDVPVCQTHVVESSLDFV